MAQQLFIYSFVARGTVILAEHAEFPGEFTSEALEWLPKLNTPSDLFEFPYHGHSYNYLVDNGFTYCVVADLAIGNRIPISYLVQITEDFSSRYGGERAATAVEKSLSEEFGPKLKERMRESANYAMEVGFGFVDEEDDEEMLRYYEMWGDDESD